MFGIGWTEFVVIAFVLLIFVGPRQLPGMFQKVGQIIGELKAASRELKNQVSNEVREIEEGLREASPKDLIDDIKGDLDFEINSPYEAVRRGEEAFKKEIHSIKDSIENDGDTSKSDEAPSAPGSGEPTKAVSEHDDSKKDPT